MESEFCGPRELFVPGHSLAHLVITSVCALGVISKYLVLMDLCIWKINPPI